MPIDTLSISLVLDLLSLLTFGAADGPEPIEP